MTLAERAAFAYGLAQDAMNFVLVKAPNATGAVFDAILTFTNQVVEKLISAALYDPDPGVVENLLNNPHVTESDVVRIVSRRPVAARSLVAVFNHARWGHRAAVRIALVYNPYTPGAIAEGLVALLESNEVEALAREPGVPARVRARAQALRGA